MTDKVCSCGETDQAKMSLTYNMCRECQARYQRSRTAGRKEAAKSNRIRRQKANMCVDIGPDNVLKLSGKFAPFCKRRRNYRHAEKIYSYCCDCQLQDVVDDGFVPHNVAENVTL